MERVHIFYMTIIDCLAIYRDFYLKTLGKYKYFIVIH